MAESKAWPKVATIKVSKKGNPYIEVDGVYNKETKEVDPTEFVLKTGDRLYFKTPQDEVDGLVAAGKMTEEQGEARKAKIPDFIKQYIYMAPRD